MSRVNDRKLPSTNASIRGRHARKKSGKKTKGEYSAGGAKGLKEDLDRHTARVGERLTTMGKNAVTATKTVGENVKRKVQGRKMINEEKADRADKVRRRKRVKKASEPLKTFTRLPMKKHGE